MRDYFVEFAKLLDNMVKDGHRDAARALMNALPAEDAKLFKEWALSYSGKEGSPPWVDR